MPRLPQELIDLINNPHQQAPMLQAVRYISEGWAVFPLAPRSKTPYADTNGVKQATRDWGTVQGWIEQYPEANLGGSTDGFLVIDVDSRSGGHRPLEWQTRWHASGSGQGSGHLIYKLTDEQRDMGFKSGSNRLGPGMDIKTGAGSYVVLPDSIHPDTGRPYESDNMPIEFLPDDLARQILESQTKPKTDGSETNTGRSILNHLLKNPPAEGGRNEWLTKVCGHYAKHFRKQPDLYFTMVAMANDHLPQPLDEIEVDKTAQSIWNTETSGHPEREFTAELDERAGWFVKGDKQILQPVMEGPKDATIVMSAALGDFDIEHLATLVDAETDSVYRHVRLVRKYDDVIEELIPAKTFGRAQVAKDWLASRGCYVMDAPERPMYKSPDWASRLGKYIAAQTAPKRLLARHLGWSDDDHAFLTHTHRIDSQGAGPYKAAQPDPNIKDSGAGQFEYGMMGSRDQARAVLAEVMTFHDESCMAAFGAWWAANLVKQWLQPIAGIFPIMAIEAASESGKTDGAFAILVKLSGNKSGAGYFTNAALRDALSSNLNGIVWIDDTDVPNDFFQTARNLTGGGTVAKKAGDNFERTAHIRLVSSLLLSGENLDLDNQKALIDRTVLISPPSPVGRMSLKPGRKNKPQYADIQDLRAQLLELGGEQAIAGQYLAMVAGWRSQVVEAYTQATTVPGRSGARDSILRAGARVLDAMLSETTGDTKKAWVGEGTWAVRLEQFLEDTQTNRVKGDNKLFIELLPTALARNNFPTHARRMGGGQPVWIEETEDGEEPTVWFNPRQLANWWFEFRKGHVDQRLDTEKSIQNQAKQAGFFGVKGCTQRVFRVSTKDESAARTRYWQITGDMAKTILDRAQG